MKLICPNCKTCLVQTSHWPGALAVGDEAECGKCGHIWQPKILRPTKNDRPRGDKTADLGAGLVVR